MRKLVTGILGCLMLLFATGVSAQDAAAVKGAVEEKVAEILPQGLKLQYKYDKEALMKSVDEADADDDGNKEASMYGQVVKITTDGTSTEVNAMFTMAKSKDGSISVSYTETDAFFTTSNIFILFCACLVFIMHLGFATLEVGLTRAKNTVNILFKNVSIVAIATIVYAIIGFNLMYPGDAWMAGKWLPAFVTGLNVPDNGMTADYAAYTYWADFLFQAMFAAATASIVSGAVCERIKLSAFLIFCTIFAGIVYPILGAAYWGGGFLGDTDFIDLAGSTLVHSVGGWGALAGAIVLGPRVGKYVNGKSVAIMGHNMPMATVGAMLLWFGWFGFNGGSQLDADPEGTSHIMVSTLLSSCAGVIGAMITSWIIQKKPDLSMILNGALAGLVGITAGAAVITGFNAVWVGLISGILVVFAVLAIDNIKIDDPVGAISVHLVCGIWGTLACGIFGGGSIGTQFMGVAYYALAFPVAFIIFFILKMTIGIRVEEEEEIEGLDIGEHGMEAYSGFQIFSNQ
ncbi:MAG: ammonium transporter [Lentisphaeraceae bacterium]|nr:ammonium transporter [Lentisphaeraceae bacterium]